MSELKNSEFGLLLGLYLLIGLAWIKLEYNVTVLILPLTFYLMIEALSRIKKNMDWRKKNEQER